MTITRHLRGGGTKREINIFSEVQSGLVFINGGVGSGKNIVMRGMMEQLFVGSGKQCMLLATETAVSDWSKYPSVQASVQELAKLNYDDDFETKVRHIAKLAVQLDISDLFIESLPTGLTFEEKEILIKGLRCITKYLDLRMIICTDSARGRL